ncbi:MAG: IS91 family transposase [Caldilineaceae bacterium]|nr:IS91 family transposase [Caldilineaceae bacterium]
MATDADLQTVMNRFLPAYRAEHGLTSREAAVCHHIQSCRTAALGGVELHCGACDYQAPWYCACRDRHCPKCQWRATQAWCARQGAAVLPVTYYHVVFTLPHALNAWVALHPAVIYQRFFRAVWATLQAFGADRRRLGGQVGATLVLHTWGQQLWRHVHLHGLIPGGALTAEGQWHAARSTYLFPDRALARHVRGRLVSELRAAYTNGELSRLRDPVAVDRLLDELMHTDWVVYTKPWLRRPETVIAYLSRYTFRTAISDARIGPITGDAVDVRYKDYRDGERWKTLRLSGAELIRRFLLHVLPKGLMRIRHYGFLANRCRRQKLAQIRAVLDQPAPAAVRPAAMPESWPCPRCHHGQLVPRVWLAPVQPDRPALAPG